MPNVLPAAPEMAKGHNAIEASGRRRGQAARRRHADDRPISVARARARAKSATLIFKTQGAAADPVPGKYVARVRKMGVSGSSPTAILT